MSRFLVKILSAFLLLVLSLVLSDGARPVAARSSGSISGRVINDIDGDGDTSDAEPGLAGWRVKLEMDTEGGQSPIVRETRTDRDGHYSLRRLPPGNYSISIPCDGQPSLWVSTAPNEQGIFLATVEAGEDSGGIDFWLSLLSAPPSHNGSIVGRLVWDDNRDGVPDPLESRVAGWQVNASMMSGSRCFPQQYQVTYAGPDGSFSFTGLQPGRYSLGNPGPSGRPHPDYVFDAPGMGQQMEDGYEYFNFLPEMEVPENGSGSIAVGILDVSGTGSISGDIYADSNENGKQDASEPLVDCGCWMGLMYRTPHGYSPVLSRVTYSSTGGVYAFSGLRSGDYWIALLQSAVTPISPPAGHFGYPFHLVTLRDGEELTDIDFGLRVQPGQPTRVPQSTPASSPTPEVHLAPPLTGTGGEPSGSVLAGLAAVLAVVGSLAISCAVLLYRWQTRREEDNA